MAEKKDFTIENYNGTDYDTLYPETNSGQVLLDTTAQATTHLSSGSTLDDALNIITKDGGGFQVGDTLTTARKNLGNNWLLCNGANVKSSKYLELSSLFAQGMFDWTSLGTTTTAITSFATNGEKGNEKFIIATADGIYFTQGSLADSSSWVKLFTSTDKDKIVSYLNNTWFVFYDNVGKYYSGDNVISDNFSNIMGLTKGAKSIVYANNNYYIATTEGTVDTLKHYVYIYSNLSTSPVKIETTKRIDIYDLYVLPEGVAQFSRHKYDTPLRKYVVYGFIIKSDTSTQDVTINSISQTQHSTNPPVRFAWFNNKYYATMVKAAEIATLCWSSTLTGYYTPVLSSSGKRLDLTNGSELLVSDDILILNKGYYVDENNVAHPWENNTEKLSNVVIGADNYYGSEGTAVYSCLKDAHFTLPTVSVTDKLYTYIKAKSKSNYVLTVKTTPDDATIEVKDADGEVVTADSEGNKTYVLTNIGGEYTVTVSKDGYTSKTVSIVNTKDQTVEITLNTV